MSDKQLLDEFNKLFLKSNKMTLVPARLGVSRSGEVTVSSIPGTSELYITFGEGSETTAIDAVGVDTSFPDQPIWVRRENNKWVIYRATYLAGGGSGGGTLNSLSDVDTSGKVDGDLLQWDSSTGQWIPFSPSGEDGTPHPLSDEGVGALHTGDLADGQAPQFLKHDGSRDLTGDLGVAPDIKIDGVDISAHAGDLNIHHNKATAGNTGVTVTLAQVISLNPVPTVSGLEMIASGVQVKEGVGIDVTAAGVNVFLKPGQTAIKVDGTGLYLDDSLAGTGLSINTARVLTVKTGEGLRLDVPNDEVEVDLAYPFIWGASHRFNVTPVINADLSFIGGDRSITGTNKITLAPTGDLWLTTAATTNLIILPTPRTLKTEVFNDFIAGIEGMDMSLVAPGGTYRQIRTNKIKADELHVRVFSADEQLVSRGAQFWARSWGRVQEDFDVPAVNATVDVWFEEAIDLSDFKLFIPYNWVQFRTIDLTSGLLTQSVWFQVVDADSTGTNNYITREDATAPTVTPPHPARQKWRLVRRSGGVTGMPIKKGNIGVDFGLPLNFALTLYPGATLGQGVVHVSALQIDDGPFVQVQVFDSVVGSGTQPHFQNKVRMGNLRGTLGYGEVDVWGFAAGNDLSIVPSSGNFKGIVVEADSGLTLYNTDILLYEGTQLQSSFTTEDGILLLQDDGYLSNQVRVISWMKTIPAGPAVSTITSYSDLPGWNHFNLTGGRDVGGHVETLLAGGTTQVLLGDEDGGGYLRLRSSNAMSLRSIHTVIGPTSETFSGVSNVTIVDNNSFVDESVGLTIEQRGSGDAVVQFNLFGGQRIVMGIDQTDSKFKITDSVNVGTTTIFSIDPATDYVGIGTASPLAKLNVVTSDQVVARFNSTSGVSSGVQGIAYIAIDPRSATSVYSSVRLAVVEASVSSFMSHLFFQVRDTASDVAPVTKLALRSDGRVGFNHNAPVSYGHFYQDDALVSSNSGVTIEQIGTGDSVIHWVRDTSIYTAGIDRSDGGKWKLVTGYDLSTPSGGLVIISFDPSTGTTFVAGLTTGGTGGGSHDPVTTAAGSGIVLAGQAISIDTAVVVTHSVLNARRVIAGAGLSDGGSDFLNGNITHHVNYGTGLALSGDQLVVDFTSIPAAGNQIVAGTGLTGGGVLSDAIVTLNVVALPTGGLETGINDIHIKLRATVDGGSGLSTTDGLTLRDDLAGSGLVYTVGTRILNVGAGNGIGVGGDAVFVSPSTNGGISVDGTGVFVKLPTLSGLETDATGLFIHRRGYSRFLSGIAMSATDGIYLSDELAGDGLEYTNSSDRTLQASLGDGLEFTGTSPAKDIRIKLPASSGLVRDTTGLYINPGAGILLTSDLITLDPAIAGTGLGINLTTKVLSVNAASGLITSGDNVIVNLAFDYSWSGNHVFGSGALFRVDSIAQFNNNANFIGSSRTFTADALLTIAPGTDLILDPGGSQVLPGGTVEDDLGYYNRKWRTLYAAELYVETLVAQEVMATIGGRIMVTPTSVLMVDVSSGSGTITVKHQDPSFVVGSYVLLQSAPAGKAQYEVMKINSTATLITGTPDTYRYTVIRNVDGSNAWPDGGLQGNAWVAGDAVVSLGKEIGSGYIDLSSTATVHNHIGPTITIYSRHSMTNWNDIVPVVTMGNLEGFVDYAAGDPEFGFAVGNNLLKRPDDLTTPFKGLTADRVNGIRLYNTTLSMYTGTNKDISLTQTNGLIFDIDTADFANVTRYVSWWTNVDTYNPLSQVYVGAYQLSGVNRLVMRSKSNVADSRIELFAEGNAGYSLLSIRPSQMSFIVDGVEFLNATITGVYVPNPQSFGVRIANPVSAAHIYENTSAIDATAGLTIEQDGAGDALLQFLITGGRRWMVGTDNTGNTIGGTDPFVIASSGNLSTTPEFVLAAGGILTVNGLDTNTLNVTGAVTLSSTLAVTGLLTATGNISTSIVSARTSAGLRLEDDGGNLGVFIQDGGRVGIGTTVPGAKLHVIDNSGGANGGISFGSSVTSAYTLSFFTDDTGLKVGHNSSSRDLEFQTFSTTRMTVLGNGNIGVGTLNPGFLFTVSSESAAPTAAITGYGAGNIPQVVFYGPNGTASAQTLNVTDDVLGQIVFQGFDTGRSTGATIRAVAAATWGTAGDTTDDPTNIIFATVPDGSGTLVDRFFIGSDGNIGVNTLTPGITITTGTDALSAYSATPLLQLTGTTPRLILRGSTDAALDLIDNGSSDNLKWMQLITDGGTTRFRSAKNDGAILKDNILLMNHNTGDVTVTNNLGVLNSITVTGTGTFSGNAVFNGTGTFANYMGIGTTSPGNWLDVQGEGTGIAIVRSSLFGTGAAFNFVGRRALGTRAAPTAVTLDAALMSLCGIGYTSLSGTGTGFADNTSAEIRFTATEAYNGGANQKGGAKIEFWTRPNYPTDTVVRLAMTITQDGWLIGNQIYANTVAAPYKPMFVSSAGVMGVANVYANTVSAPYKPMFVSDTGVMGTVNINGVTVTTATVRSVYVDGNGFFGGINSSRRFKDDISTIDGEFIAKVVMALRPVQYKSKGDESRTNQWGFIAEEVHETGAKELVHYDKDGEPESIPYERFIVPAIGMIQQLQRQIDSLREELERLRKG